MSTINTVNKNFLIGIGVVALLVVGFMMFSNKPQTTPPPATTTTEETASPSAAMSDVTITLSEQNKSGESGTATLSEVDGKVKVMLEMSGAPKDIAQPAHIHVGVCPDVGAVKYPLTSPINGVSETMLDVTLAQLKAELPLGINVHKSGEEATVYVSCGDLKL